MFLDMCCLQLEEIGRNQRFVTYTTKSNKMDTNSYILLQERLDSLLQQKIISPTLNREILLYLKVQSWHPQTACLIRLKEK